MSTMREVLNRAIRMTRARTLGDTPSAEEIAAVLEDAQSMFLTFPIRRLTDVWISANYEAGENERISVDPDETVTVTLPESVTDDDGVERAPQNGAMVEVCGASPAKYIYISTLGGWQELTDLGLEDEQPFGPVHDLDVAAMIAARVSGPVLQRDPPGDVLALAQQGRTNIRNAFRQIQSPNYDRALLSTQDLINLDAAS